jgi:hypothetical protein
MVVMVRGTIYEVHRSKGADDADLFDATPIALDERLAQSFMVVDLVDYKKINGGR